jgi:hypothetical protein
MDPLANVVLQLTGTESRSFTSDESGNYAIEGLDTTAKYTLSPSKRGYDFTQKHVEIVPSTDSFRQDFKATNVSYDISGTTADASGMPLSDVTLTLDGKARRIIKSNSQGDFLFPGVPGAKSYTVRPEKAGYTFTPPALPIVYLLDGIRCSFYGSADVQRDKPPSQWSALNDYSKTIITLASGLLALSVTFSGQVITKRADEISTALLVATWIFLVLAIASGVLTAVFLIEFLRKNRNEKLVIFCANSSYFALGVAGIFFLVFGSYSIRFWNRTWDPATSIERAEKEMSGFAGINDSTWTVQEMKWDEGTKTYQLLLVGNKTSEKFKVTVDPAKNAITHFERLAPVADSTAIKPTSDADAPTSGKSPVNGSGAADSKH